MTPIQIHTPGRDGAELLLGRTLEEVMNAFAEWACVTGFSATGTWIPPMEGEAPIMVGVVGRRPLTVLRDHAAEEMPAEPSPSFTETVKRQAPEDPVQVKRLMKAILDVLPRPSAIVSAMPGKDREALLVVYAGNAEDLGHTINVLELGMHVASMDSEKQKEGG